MELERRPQKPMNGSFSPNGRPPGRDWGAIDPGLNPGEEGPQGWGDFGWAGLLFRASQAKPVSALCLPFGASRPTLGEALPTAEGWFRGESCGFGLAAHLPLPRRDPLRERLRPPARASKLSAGKRRGRAPKGKPSVPSGFASGTQKRSPSQLTEKSLFFTCSTAVTEGTTFPSRNFGCREG